MTQLADTEKTSGAKWNELPPVSSVNPVRLVKPGATVLLTGTTTTRQDQVVLAYQRYGRGKALAFPIQDSWLWKMDARMAVTDTTHATFWRRLVRWLVDGVPEPVSITTAVDRVEPGEPMKLTAAVVDTAFADVNDARVIAQVTAPSGKTTEVPLEWTCRGTANTAARSCPMKAGMYQVKATANRDGQELGTHVMHARAAAGDSEYFDAEMRTSLLTRVAEETGGRFFTPESASTLPEAISYSGRGVTVVEERDLWDMPSHPAAAARPDRRRVDVSTEAGAGVMAATTAIVRSFPRSADLITSAAERLAHRSLRSAARSGWSPWPCSSRPSLPPRTRTCWSSRVLAATTST